MNPTKLLVVYIKKGTLSSICSGCLQSNHHSGHDANKGDACSGHGMMRWKCIPKPYQSWNQWNAFNKLMELNAITAESMGYGTSNITGNMVATDVAIVLDN